MVRSRHAASGAAAPSAGPDAAGFAEVFRAELDMLAPGLPATPGATSQDPAAEIDAMGGQGLAALCLSGGGIRSASFALGVLQALARFGVLGEFHYLSTVSGGGYVGSFLTAWRHAAGDDAAVMGGLDRTTHDDGREAPEIAALRADSNYLTPRRGVLSPDTWTDVALTIRNLVLNWLVWLPFFAGVLFLPKLLFTALGEGDGALVGSGPTLLGVGACLAAAGLAVASYGRRRSYGRWLTDGRFVVLTLTPVAAASVCFTAAAMSPMADAWRRDGALVLEAAQWGAVAYAGAWLIAAAALASTARDARRRAWDGLLDLAAWAASGAATGALLAAGIRDEGRSLTGLLGSDGERFLVVFGMSWTMLSVLAGELLFVGLRSYAATGDEDREWLARAAGWLTAGAVSWGVLSGAALFGPFVLGSVYAWAWTALGGASGAVSIVLGGGASTAAIPGGLAGGRLKLSQIVAVAGVAFGLTLIVFVSVMDGALTGWAMRLCPWAAAHPARFCAAGLALLPTLAAVFSLPVNVNRFSLHALYRNRLIRAFLGAARAGRRRPDPFTGFDRRDNLRLAEMPTGRLLHVINATLNVTASGNLAWQERKAEPFTMTPLHCGSEIVGYRETKSYGDKLGGITLGTAMAISGAAVSPNMGYHSSPVVSFLLALFNARLGWWLGNPARDGYRKSGPGGGLRPFLAELAGRTDDSGEWVYLSDGGHFDNLGLYEMVRRRCRFIVVVDAGEDPGCALGDLGDTLRKIYVDQGVAIGFDRFEIERRCEPPRPGRCAAIATITYPGSSDAGWLLYVKPGYHGDEGAAVTAYAAANPSFPHESTVRQWFGESQFEAYRALGAHIMERLCAGGSATKPTGRPASLDLGALRANVEKTLESVTEST